MPSGKGRGELESRDAWTTMDKEDQKHKPKHAWTNRKQKQQYLS
jgi:hypothetical protein